MDDEVEVAVDGVSYGLAHLGAEARAQVRHLRYVEAQIADLNAKPAVDQTARNSHQAALSQLVPRTRQ